MRCRWLPILCLCAVIQIPLIKGYPNGYNTYANRENTGITDRPHNQIGNQNDNHRGYSYGNGLIVAVTQGSTNIAEEEFTANPNAESNFNTGEDISSTTKRTSNVLHLTRSSNKRHTCTISTQHYDCQIQNVHLRKDEISDFGLQDNHETKLTFQDSTLEYLPKSLIDAFPKMELLNLNDMKITEIQENAFEKAANLRELYLANNRLKHIPYNTFYGAKKLEMLSLSYNEISSFNHIFNSNTLWALYLDFNKLVSLPNFQNSFNLEYVNASHNQLQSISDNHFANQLNLKNLDLSFNRLRQLNLEQVRSKLELVDVSHNELVDLIPPINVNKLMARNNSLESMQVNKQQCSLKYLDLALNNLKFLPNLDICNQLETLDLSYNKLEAIPNLKTMQNLQHLNLAHNNLFDFDSKLPSLIELDLSYNQLSYGPSLTGFKKLKSAYFNNNKLISLRKSPLPPSLIAFRMSHNIWNCKDIQQYEQKIEDKNPKLHCGQDMLNSYGICCKNYTKPFNEALNVAVQDAAFHERSNRDQCKKPASPLASTPNNIDQLRKAASQADAGKAKKLNELAAISTEKQNLQAQLNNQNDRLQKLEAFKEILGREIEKQRKIYRVTKEGLISNREMLERIIQFVDERKHFNNNLLKRRELETGETENLFDEKKEQNDELLSNTKKLEETLVQLKSDEKAKKKEKDRLERKVNRNSPSIHGSTGLQQ